MDNTECCFVCGSFNTELHHIVFRSQNKQLEDCYLNHIRLCPEHHRGTNGVHGKKGHKLDKVLKLHFQNTLEIVFFKELLTREEIKEVLDISDKPLNRLLKPLVLQKGKYVREDVIRACMGGKMIVEVIVNDT